MTLVNAARIVEQTIENGGGTFQPFNQDAITTGYVLSVNPELEQIVPLDVFDADVVQDYIFGVYNHFGVDHTIGTWVHDDNVYLDVVVHIKDKEGALELAREYNQLAVFDVAAQQEVSV